MTTYASSVLSELEAKNPGEPEFLQAAGEVLTSIEPVLGGRPHYRDLKVLERLVEPERTIIFRVSWTDDFGEVQVNRGFRVQMNSAIGPYKGGLRFHPTVDLGVMKFLAFEQTLKNGLTTLPLGGAKGGSDFDPKGRSDGEVRRFCQAFMTELYRHIGQFTDIPAGDIGVGIREIGFLFGQYKRITNQFTGVITGKGPNWGGSQVRPEATGYGVAYFAVEMLATRDHDLEGKRCLVSGAGNVAQYTVEKLVELGAVPVTMSDSNGFIVDPDGIDREKLAWIKELKNVRRGRIREYAEQFERATFTSTDRSEANGIWAVPADCAFPCATQNEISVVDAGNLIANEVLLVVEGANMPTVPKAVAAFLDAGVLFGPGKAANAGGVAVSGLEMTQDAAHLSWTREQVDERLRSIMAAIHRQSSDVATEYGHAGNYVVGANVAGFLKVADAMVDESTV
jgi:glutamate dehydrogenase (NADP+)